MDSAVLGLASSSGCGCCTVWRVFGTEVYTLEDAIELHAFAPPLEALACVWPMAFLSGGHCLSPVHTVNCVQTLEGEGVVKNFVKAVALLKAAVAQGCVEL